MRSSVQMFCIEQGIEGIMDVAITAALKSKDYDRSFDDCWVSLDTVTTE